MKVLKAPHTLTLDQITSKGELHFESGIATEFTKEQAQHLCENIPGYEVVEIADKEPSAPATPKIETVPEEEPSPPVSETTEEEGKEEVTGDPGIGISTPVLDATNAPETVSKEETQPPVSETTEEEKPEESGPTIYTKAVHRNVGKAKKFIIKEFGEQISDDDIEALTEAEKADRNRGTFIEWLGEIAAIVPDEKDGEHLETDSDDRPPDGEEDRPKESGESEGEEGTETTEEESGGQEDKTDTEDEGIILPVIQDDIEVVRAFARDHGINDEGDKAVILELIYSDKRFK